MPNVGVDGWLSISRSICKRRIVAIVVDTFIDNQSRLEFIHRGDTTYDPFRIHFLGKLPFPNDIARAELMAVI